MITTVLVIHFYVTNHLKLSGLKQTSLRFAHAHCGLGICSCYEGKSLFLFFSVWSLS